MDVNFSAFQGLMNRRETLLVSVALVVIAHVISIMFGELLGVAFWIIDLIIVTRNNR